MSSPESLQRQIYINHYVAIASYTIFYHDYFLTLRREIQYFWRRRHGTATVFFFLNRYVSFFGILPLIISNFFDWSVKMSNISGIPSVLCSGSSTNCWRIDDHSHLCTVQREPENSFVYIWNRCNWCCNSMGCNPSLTNDAGHRLAVAWGGLLLFDTAIFSLTLYKTLEMWRMGDRQLIVVLMRDGLMYYSVLCVANLSNILSFLLAEGQLKGSPTPTANVLSVTLISRLMINLRDPELYNSTGRTTATGTHIGPFGVSTVVDVGTMGGTLLSYDNTRQRETFDDQEPIREIELDERC
ncbi:hypothetical protein BD410DRAFT_91988 [Rickenella mellea]|uniref:DUF6533 domain-containing protein n=1 Tax=Rickenella mellea TaxID=50990 RepID=A0A4Y7QAW0_9AGAM|nr:hypothetical protein BD410DRAFT_91988 [Rickenella mellea]